MEIKYYLRILIRRWWLVAACGVIFLVLGLIIVLNQPRVYETKSSFVLRPHSSVVIAEDTVGTIDTISRRIEIASTFAEVVGSNKIHNQAIERLGLSESDGAEFSVTGKVVAGTNVLELSARGPDPVLVKEFADAATLETIEFVNNLFDVFELQSLDPASTRNSPVSSSRTRTLGAITILGLVVGVGLAFIVEYFQLVTSDTNSLEIIDYESGIYNRAYFMLRLREEITRSQRNRYIFALALVEIVTADDGGDDSGRFKIDVLRKIISVISTNLREEDVITRYDKTTLSLMLPDRTVGSAREILMEAQQRLSDFSLRSASEPEFYITAGITSFQDDIVNEDALLQQATDALKIAKDSESHQIQVYIDDSQSIAAESIPSSTLAYSETD